MRRKYIHIYRKIIHFMALTFFVIVQSRNISELRTYEVLQLSVSHLGLVYLNKLISSFLFVLLSLLVKGLLKFNRLSYWPEKKCQNRKLWIYRYQCSHVHRSTLYLYRKCWQLKILKLRPLKLNVLELNI